MRSTVMVTGGKGFIGSNFLNIAANRWQDNRIVNVDCETYAARPPINPSLKNVTHEKVDIRDQLAVHRLMVKYDPALVIHLAAESHVCRSIIGPKDFITTNINGTYNLLEELKELGDVHKRRFVHISTDEVYGEIMRGTANEESQYRPRSPYAASKAASDHLVKAYHETYGLDTVTLNMANNFGPNQHEEKLIPRTIRSILEGKPIIVHGQGDHVREWLFVWDACDGIIKAADKGIPGASYCFGGALQMKNIDMMTALFELCRSYIGGIDRAPKFSLEHTNDRPTDDYRYAMSSERAALDFGFSPGNYQQFQQNLKLTVDWYANVILNGGAVTDHGRKV